MARQSPSEKMRSSRSLWVWVVIAFIVLICAWSALIVIATRNQPELIQIETP